jgi:hypothetical protein
MAIGSAGGVRRLAGALALLGGVARADAQAPAGTLPRGALPPGAPLRIWYRSSEGCPDGSVFVARLLELGRAATLARVGDRVDFVVTVATSPQVSSGRLERQTARGTVAIRELEAPRCEEVADALALSLEIALEPQHETAPTAASGTDGAATDATGSARPLAGVDRGALDAAMASSERRVLQFGAQASVGKGLAPSWAPGGALFVELRTRTPTPLAGRVSLAGAGAADTIARVDVDVLSLTGRVEGCAFELRSGSLSLEPCVGAELGLLRASSSGDAARTDQGVWGAGMGLGRASLELDARFALEAQVGATVPFVRYAVGSSLGGTLFRTEPVIGALAIGARWSP